MTPDLVWQATAVASLAASVPAGLALRTLIDRADRAKAQRERSHDASPRAAR